MKVHIIGTINGIENEGMRNIATHLAREIEKTNTVYYSGLKEFGSIFRNCLRSDVTIVFARANKAVYWLTRLLQILCRHVYIFCVQKPREEFVSLNRKWGLKCGWFSIVSEDLQEISSERKYTVPVGIDTTKFSPVNAGESAKLRQQYGFSNEKPLVVHVGHCSAGRGLEDFLTINGERVQRLVVASGMFENAQTAEKLESAGVSLHRGFLPDVEDIYRMADCCLFPTRSEEYVISVPLSVMESLACGTPVVGYHRVRGLDCVAAEDGGITRIEDVSGLEKALLDAAKKKQNRSLLKESQSWAQAAEVLLSVLKEEIR